MAGLNHTNAPAQLKGIVCRLKGPEDWLSIEGAGDAVLALKGDGTLWSWGPHCYPSRINTQSNWIDIAIYRHNYIALKSDRTIWQFVTAENNPDVKVAHLEARLFDSSQHWIEIQSTGNWLFGQSQDGSYWIWCDPRIFPGNTRHAEQKPPWIFLETPGSIEPGFFKETLDGLLVVDQTGVLFNYSGKLKGAEVVWKKERVDKGTKWVAACSFGSPWVTQYDRGAVIYYGLTRDGSVWHWGLPLRPRRMMIPYSMRPRRIAGLWEE